MTKLQKIFIVIISVFLIISRFIFSELITPSLTHDEMIYAINAKSLFLSGQDLSKSTGIFSLKPFHHMYAEFPASLMSLGSFIKINPILTSHFLPTIFSVTLPFILAWIVWSIYKNKSLSISMLFIAATNPLYWQFSRLSYDSFFSLYFYLLASAVYLHFQDKRKYWSVPIFFIGFFNYQGFKLLLLPIVFWNFAIKHKIYSIKKLTSINIKSLVLPIFALLLTLYYGFMLLPNQAASTRINQTIFTDKDSISQITQGRRRNSLNPNIGRYFSNQIFSTIEIGANNLFSALNPTMIFFRGEQNTSGFSAWSHGYFYLVDIFLLILGIYVFIKSKKFRPTSFLFALLFISSLLPAFLNSLSEWYLLRSLITYTILLVFISIGLHKTLHFKRLKWVIFIIYAISISNFAYQYYFQYPIYRSNAAELHERIVNEYASRVKDQTIYIYDDEPHYLYMSHLLYKDLLNKENINKYQDRFINQNYAIENVIYTNECADSQENDAIIYSTLYYPCQDDAPNTNITIPSILDGGGKYRIFGDKLCSKFELQPYSRVSSHQNFQFSNLSDQEFCRIWIANQK